MLITSIIRAIFPEDLEAEDLPIVVEEAVEVLVGAASLEHDLDVVLVLGQVGRVLLHVDHRPRLHERVGRVLLRYIQGKALIAKETPSKIITVNDPEDSAVDFDVALEVEISPGVVLGRGKVGHGDLVALQKYALRDARVFLTLFYYVERIIL